MTEYVIIFGAIAGGFVSGLTGFGTGLTVMAIWLLVIPPVIAAPLVVICSIAAQLQTLPMIWREIKWTKVAPFILGGALGVPVGAHILINISGAGFRFTIGVVLIIYCTFALMRLRLFEHVPEFLRRFDAVIGFGGGVLGGMAGLSGVLPSVWATLLRWNKTEMRTVFQTFNLSILLLALLYHLFQNTLSADVFDLSLVAVPGTFLGAWTGKRVYSMVDDKRYQQIILTLLMLSGLSLVLAGLF